LTFIKYASQKVVVQHFTTANIVLFCVIWLIVFFASPTSPPFCDFVISEIYGLEFFLTLPALSSTYVISLQYLSV